MSNCRVLVTGANGYIGVHVIQALLDRGCDAVACDLKFDRVPDDAEKLNVDIFDPSVDVFHAAGEPDCLIHLAWRDGFQHNAPSHMQDLPRHYQFLETMVSAGIKSLSVMGSMHEVGYWEGAITADTPTNPLSLYGIAKNALRQSVSLLVKGKDVSFHWLRGYYITGDDERSNSIFGKLLLAEHQGKAFFPFTSGKNKYDYLTIQELAAQIVEASLQSEYQGIINCCSGIPISLGERVEQFIQENHLQIRLQYGAFPDRAYDSPGVWGDAAVIRKIMENAKEKS